jgi:hypothetical protein
MESMILWWNPPMAVGVVADSAKSGPSRNFSATGVASAL